MRKLSTLVLVLSALAVLGACGASPTDTAAADKAAAATPTKADGKTSDATSELLYALHGRGTLHGTTLQIVTDTEVAWVTDRPERHAGRTHTASLVEGWAAAGFTDDPPNAILLTDDSSVAVELTAPRWDDSTKTLRFTVAALSGDVLPTGDLNAVDLFIDDADFCGTSSTALLSLNNLPASSTFGGCVFNTTASDVYQQILNSMNSWRASHPAAAGVVSPVGLDFPAEVFNVSFRCHNVYTEFVCYGSETPAGQATLSVTSG